MRQLKHSQLIVKKSPIHGYGVFADQLFKVDDIIEECYTVTSSGGDLILNNYYFDVHGINGIPTGFGVIYNHSNQPNAYYYFEKIHNIMVIKAKRTIRKGEEICISYGDSWLANRKIQCKKIPLWYKIIHCPMKSFIRASLFTLGFSLLIQFLHALTVG